MTVKYQMVIDRIPDEEGGGYVAYYPDLAGCFSDGEDPATAAKNAVDALECWISAQIERGAPVPEPGTALADFNQRLDDMRSEHEQVRADLENAKVRIRALEKAKPQGWQVRLPLGGKQAAFG